ncbi:uncharacterized protein LOC143147459 [Ptiloglossa arizonensis]|uniref:uncharacterized protein LOC143147459 n=1 Tax=Ptiloglossa arizonensis TaxID=3350558 RepID=UPI003F9FA421
MCNYLGLGPVPAQLRCVIPVGCEKQVAGTWEFDVTWVRCRSILPNLPKNSISSYCWELERTVPGVMGIRLAEIWTSWTTNLEHGHSRQSPIFNHQLLLPCHWKVVYTFARVHVSSSGTLPWSVRMRTRGNLYASRQLS